jgi:tetratricopeptide (TPR) repeat protein
MSLISRHLRATILMALCFSAYAISAQQAGNDLYVQVDPNPVVVGKASEFHLVSTTASAEILEFPDIPGIKWSKRPPMTSYSSNMITKESLFKTIYSFNVTKEGEYVIPSLKIKMGHLEKKTVPYKFQAFKEKLVDRSGKEYALDDLLYMTALLMTNRDYVYVGEEVPLQIRLYSVKPLRLTWIPEKMDMEVENIVRKDYKGIIPKYPYFSSITTKTVKDKGQEFKEVILKGAIRPISKGTLQGTITMPARVILTRYPEIRSVNTELSSKTVIPLPPMEKDTNFLGLVGEWEVNCSLSDEKLKAGEPVTLTIKIKGKGTLETLTPPELTLEGFSIFPPEVKKGQPTSASTEEGEIKYAIIPKKSGETQINIAFSTFSPEQEKYIKTTFSRSFDIEKSDDPSGGFVSDPDKQNGSLSPVNDLSGSNKPRNEILYLKTESNGAVSIPLRDNKLFLIILFFLTGPAVLIVSELVSYRKKRLSDDPLLRRKSNAKRRKRKVLNKLKSAEGKDELHEIIQNDLTPLVNDLYGFPPGTSTDELAEKVTDPKLSACLKSGSSSSYMPGNTAEFNAESLKANLLKAMKKLPVILFLFFSISLYGESTGKTANDARTLYDNQEFKEAEKVYKGLLDPKKPDPTILYNLGNCAYKIGNLPKALVYFERARRLSPSDSDIMENLNFIRRKLSLPEIGKSNNPIDSIQNFRDFFRPDAWALMIAITWSLCWLSLVARRFLSIRKWTSSLVISMLLFTLSLIAYFSQQSTTYNPENAIVVKRGTDVYVLPSEKSEEAGLKLRAGYEVTVEEERHNWLRVRDENSEGWVKSDALERLWPY